VTTSIATQDIRSTRARKGRGGRSTIASVLAVAALLAGLVTGTGAAIAQEPAAGTAPITIELNKLAANGAACQATIVARNGGDEAITSLKADLVMFAPDGVVARRVAVELGPLAARKTFVKAFDVPQTGCADIGRILLNDIVACADADGEAIACLDRIETSSRAAAPFEK
jgi:hypothetical protein